MFLTKGDRLTYISSHFGVGALPTYTRHIQSQTNIVTTGDVAKLFKHTDLKIQFLKSGREANI